MLGLIGCLRRDRHVMASFYVAALIIAPAFLTWLAASLAASLAGVR